MIQEADLRSKTDAELLQIWRDQVDYREDVITWVKHEIAKRNLDAAAVHVDTVEEKVQAETTQEEFKWLFLLAVFQGIAGFAICLFAAIAAFSEAGFFILFSLLMMIIGGLLVGIAVGVARRRRWAFTASMILWGFSAGANVIGFLAAFTRIQGAPAGLEMTVFRIIISVLFARAYSRMRDTCPPGITNCVSEDILSDENADTFGPS